MNFKKRVNGSWTDTPHYIHKTDTDILTTLPDVVYVNDTTATVGLKGNTVQSGTPSSQNPIMPEGTGERTENLLSEKYENRSINGIGAFTIDSNYDLWLGEVVAGQTYAISNMDYVYGFFTTKPLPNTGVTYDGTRGYESSRTTVITVPSGCTWIAVRVLHNADNAMLNLGSTALPYEPYGYKIPISINNVVTNIYIGDNPLRKSLDGTAYDTLAADGTLTRRVDSDGSVLPTPIVTQVTMPTFTTTPGANTLDVLTTVPPSEVTATFNGWHPVSSAHERDNGAWT